MQFLHIYIEKASGLREILVDLVGKFKKAVKNRFSLDSE